MLGLAEDDVISIHASREGSDICGAVAALLFDISIHASREGSDYQSPLYFTIIIDFYPRIP